MPTLPELIPDAQTLIDLEPEELGGVLLHVFGEVGPPGLHLNNFEGSLFMSHAPAYPREFQYKIAQALREAWAWLEGQALIVWGDSANGQNGWRVASRRAKRISSTEDWGAYRQANRLPKDLLHPKIASAAYFNFLRGEYDTAVFQAFKIVEVATREAGGFGPETYGASLMRAAFKPDETDPGPLADLNQEYSERKGRADLFAGAIASYKNPHSHRDVGTAVADAVELLLLASHLLRIVDQRAPASRL